VKNLDADDLARLASYKDIVEALRRGFRQEIATPTRHHHALPGQDFLLLMPAWSQDHIGVKTVVFKPGNPKQGLPTITATYQLFDQKTGAAVALIDGTELTRRRTAAASALAASYLAKPEAKVLAMIGAGALARHFIRAHASVRPIAEVRIFSRTRDKSESVAQALQQDGFEVHVAGAAEDAVREADIVSCATTTTSAIVQGKWLKPGAHVDLAGAFTPKMRECDGETVSRSSVFVDTLDGARAEAGDLLQAEAEGKFDFQTVKGDLSQLCRGTVKGRERADEITLFKSCGTAVEDLAAAQLYFERAT
jgi:ornithine cyclodeaminase